MRLRNDRIVRASRVLVSASRRNNLFLTSANSAYKRTKGKFALASTRDACAPQNSQTRAGDYSPKRWRNCARAYSRFSFAIKLALISAGHTASHS